MRRPGDARGTQEQNRIFRLRCLNVRVSIMPMSTTFPCDDLRIPPMPRTIRIAARPRTAALPLQLAAAAATGFFLAWVLTRFVIG